MDIQFNDKNGNKSDSIKTLICSMLDIITLTEFSFAGLKNRAMEQLSMSCLAMGGVKSAISEINVGNFLTSKEIIKHWNKFFGDTMSEGSYDSIRDNCVKKLVESGIAISQAKEASLTRNSSTAGYALSEPFVSLVNAFGTTSQDIALERFKAYQATVEPFEDEAKSNIHAKAKVSVDAMKKSFLLYLQKTSKQMQNHEDYVNSICKKLDVELQNIQTDYKSIYQITSERVLVDLVQTIIKNQPDLDGLLESTWDEASTKKYKDYVLWTTLKQYRDYLILLSASSFIFKNYDIETVRTHKKSYIFTTDQPLQQIYYGAPGTGKSHATNDVTSKYPDTVRTTFHPDSDYSTFVGAYKPTMSNPQKRYELDGNHKVFAMQYPEGDSKTGFICETKIEYKFVKQAFLKAYVKAWKLFKETCVEGGELAPQFLVIEEINRGNCAQIFGDLFQLLDRKQNFSEYPVEADADICKALLEEDTKDNPSFGAKGLQLTEDQKAYINNIYDGKPVAEKICNGEVLVLPPNFYIWATMNTSDQSLFPIDSAFKRRWEWKYMKIKQGYKKDEQGNIVLDAEGKKVPLGWKIEIKGEDEQVKLSQDWWSFIQKINTIVASMTSSADKQLGYFFCKADKDGVISGETFVSKVIFYLWNDVFKDYGFEDASLFRYKVKEGEKEEEKDLTFPDFYDEDGEKVNAERLVDFIQKVMAWQKPEENA